MSPDHAGFAPTLKEYILHLPSGITGTISERVSEKSSQHPRLLVSQKSCAKACAPIATAVSERRVGPGITVVCINPIPNIREGPDNQIKVILVDDIIIQHLKMMRSKVCRIAIWRLAGARIARRSIIRSYHVDRIRMVNTYTEVIAVYQRAPILGGSPIKERPYGRLLGQRVTCERG